MTQFRVANTINFSFIRWLAVYTRNSADRVASDRGFLKLLLIVLWVSLAIRIVGTLLLRIREYLVYLPNFVGDLLVLFCLFLMSSIVIVYLVLSWHYNITSNW